MIIIDGHNLIGNSKIIKLSDKYCKSKLLNMLLDYQNILSRKIIVVFDGSNFGSYERMDFENIEVRYSIDKSADDLIFHLIDKLQRQNGVCVISSDNAIIDYAKKHHISTQSSRDFMTELQNVLSSYNSESEKYLSPVDVNKWMEIFKNKK